MLFYKLKSTYCEIIICHFLHLYYYLALSDSYLYILITSVSAFYFPFHLFALINTSISFLSWIQAVIKQDLCFVLVCIFFMLVLFISALGSKVCFSPTNSCIFSIYFHHHIYSICHSLNLLVWINQIIILLTIFTISLSLSIWEEVLISV